LKRCRVANGKFSLYKATKQTTIVNIPLQLMPIANQITFLILKINVCLSVHKLHFEILYSFSESREEIKASGITDTCLEAVRDTCDNR